MIVQLRRSACYIEVFHVGAGTEDIQAPLNRRFFHHFASLRTGIHMAMLARLITKLSEIHLQGFDAAQAKIGLFSNVNLVHRCARKM